MPFTYDLPKDRIAQRPIYPYHDAKLLVVDREANSISEDTFYNIDKHLEPSDLLVFNNSKVRPARLFGRLADTGGEIELLTLEEQFPGVWQCLGRPLKKLKAGTQIEFEEGLSGTVQERVGAQKVIVQFSSSSLDETGVMPIPPYIRQGRGDEQDVNDYQTYFAEVEGSVAAPTASLHFTPELVAKLDQFGCQREFVTLHVGPPSFLPLGDAQPGEERYFCSADLIAKLVDAKKEGRRVIGVGTTVARVLETVALEEGVANREGETDLFIEPGHEFKFLDGLITNFHQPGTTHLLLVEAFAGKTMVSALYDYAINNDFRFLSYGDGVLLK